MKIRIALASLAFVVACEHSSDLAAMQQEATGIVKTYTEKLDEMQERGTQIARALEAVPATSPGFADANKTLAEANDQFQKLREVVKGTPDRLAAAVKSGNPNELRTLADLVRGEPTNAPGGDMEVELQRVMDSLQSRLENGYTVINSELDAVDAAVARANAMTTSPTAPPPAPGSHEASDEPAPPPPPAPVTPTSPPGREAPGAATPGSAAPR